MRIQLNAIAAAVTLALLLVGFQNCGPTAVFEGGSAAKAVDSSSGFDPTQPGPKDNQTGEAISGGEGYGGKSYVMINSIEVCTGSEPNQGEIYIDNNGQAFLTVRDCERLTTPESINVIFGPGADFIQYNGQYYQEVSSTAVFDNLGLAAFSLTFQAESLNRLPNDGVIDGAYFRITDNDYISEPVDFSEVGSYWIVVHAKGQNDFTNEQDALMDIRIDGVSQGVVEVSDHSGEYWYDIQVDSIGTKEVSLHFLNDRHQTSPQLNKNLMLDYLIIAKQAE